MAESRAPQLGRAEVLEGELDGARVPADGGGPLQAAQAAERGARGARRGRGWRVFKVPLHVFRILFRALEGRRCVGVQGLKFKGKETLTNNEALKWENLQKNRVEAPENHRTFTFKSIFNF